LGRCYETGRGVTISLPDALRCFQIAASHYSQAQAAYQRVSLIIAPIGKTSISSILTQENGGEFKKTEKKKIGKGSQGEIYKDRWRNEDVAVKYLSVPITDVQRRRAEIINQCDYLMRIKAFYQTPLCIVSEYIPWSNLTEFLRLILPQFYRHCYATLLY
jgi:hypothetical protein